MESHLSRWATHNRHREEMADLYCETHLYPARAHTPHDDYNAEIARLLLNSRWFASHDCAELPRLFSNHGANMQYRDNNGDPPLLLAIYSMDPTNHLLGVGAKMTRMVEVWDM